MLLGPVPARVLVDKLYRGEIDARTPVCRDGNEDFVPIDQVDFFKVHAKKAQVKVQLERDTAQVKTAQGRERRTKVLALAGAGVLLLGVGAYGAYYLAVNKPWRTTNEADLVAIQIDPPTISLAGPKDDAVAVELPASTGATSPSPSNPGKHPLPAGHRTRTAPTPGAGPQPAEPDGMAGGPTFDASAIKQAADSKMGSLRPCVVAEATKHVGEPGRLQFELSVKNDGRVGKVWIDGAYGSAGEFHDCVMKVVSGWSFPHYEGEQANVTLGMSWGPKH
jgi:hypothetical protein